MRRLDAELQKHRSDVIDKDGQLCVQEQAFLDRTNQISAQLHLAEQKVEDLKLEMQTKNA